MNIKGKRIIVTGGGSGMGNAAVRRFADEGARVVTIDLNDQQAYKDVIAMKGNVTDKAQITEVIGEAVKKLGGLDALFNIAGVNRFCKVEETAEDTMDFILSVNVKGLLFCCQAAFPYLKENGGSIINFGSQAADNSGPDSAIYSASKAAVASITRKIAWEWGQYGIRANTVEPSAWTPLFEQISDAIPFL